MIKIILLILMLQMSTSAYSMTALTKGGYPACLKEEWIKDMIDFVASQDKNNFEAYVQLNKCILLEENLQVTVTSSPGVFGRIASFVYGGIKFWTLRDALKYGQ